MQDASGRPKISCRRGGEEPAAAIGALVKRLSLTPAAPPLPGQLDPVCSHSTIPETFRGRTPQQLTPEVP